ncbi:diguanylate cyclase domain-containing protein [Pseudoduganella sp. GCM10020061]|uniref:sensor domain-containing diguanylate cyclase n=1 Tax=Pseudoduganella sp. GCM10020061 TaxID=3317345 RepID=UPI0036427725
MVCLLTGVVYSLHVGGQRNLVADHAGADATQFQWGLQNGINANLQRSRELGGFVVASQALTMAGFRTYAERMRILEGGTGMSYVGFVPRVARPAGAPVSLPGAGSSGVDRRGGDPDHTYPYLYVFPDDERSAAARGLDFASVPERWEAMQAARDTGQSVATRKHSYQTGEPTTPIIVLFTPVYDLSRATATVEQRRAALRGFVFSMHQIDIMVEKVMGREFRTYFDLEIFDGPVSREHLVYDGDQRAHVLFKDRDFPVVHRELLDVGGRQWQLFFFPKKPYFERYESLEPVAILVAGLLLSVALAALTAAWLHNHRARVLAQGQALRFDAVFQDHPSAVYLLDRQRRFVNANAQASRELKVAKEGLIGQSIAAFIAPDKQELAAECFEEALQGVPVSYDSAILDKEGERSELSVIMMPIRAVDQVSTVLVFAQNTTAQKRREWELAESRRMLQRVVNHIPQRVFWKDLSLRYLGCNNAFAQDAGLDAPEQIVGKTDFDLAWRANAEAYRADDRAVLQTGDARINYEERQDRADGTVSWLRTSKIPLAGMDGRVVALLGLYEDITPRKEMEAQLREMAHYDGLTRLSNRSFFYHQLEQGIQKARRHGRLLALMYFDVDHFKQVNDANGHDVGDALLTEFAARIRASVRETDAAARLGGDEFAVLLDDVPDRQVAQNVAEKLVAAMQVPFRVGGRELAVSTSIGVAFFQDGMASDDLVQRADQAMYRAKRAGRNRYEIDVAPLEAAGPQPRAPR